MNETVQIPKGWELKKISDICNVDTGYAFKSNNFQTKGIPLIRIGNIQNDKITLKNNTVFLDKKLASLKIVEEIIDNKINSEKFINILKEQYNF